ncbi:MAG TPA: hypothetical protein VFT02_09265 [Pyrinomonadaceae bacterium]|nr:hypothetical protein [Pyrinomonadaceae bacterium]
MVILLFTSVLFFGLLVIAIYFWQKPRRQETFELPPPPPPPGSLFSDFRVNQLISPPEERLTEVAPSKVDAQMFEQAIAAIREYQKSPNRNSTAKLLHAAALSDDAKNYERAIELVLLSWRDGSLADISAQELQSIFNSEYWVLSSRTRTSGAGFVLKETLSRANRELELPNSRSN